MSIKWVKEHLMNTILQNTLLTVHACLCLSMKTLYRKHKLRYADRKSQEQIEWVIDVAVFIAATKF